MTRLRMNSTIVSIGLLRGVCVFLLACDWEAERSEDCKGSSLDVSCVKVGTRGDRDSEPQLPLDRNLLFKRCFLLVQL